MLMGIEMIRVEPHKPDISIRDGDTSSAIPRKPNPSMFANIQIKNGFPSKPGR